MQETLNGNFEITPLRREQGCGRALGGGLGQEPVSQVWQLGHQEVVYAFPPSGLIRHVVRKASANSALCVLVVPVATTAVHWSNLAWCSLLSGRHAPDGYLRIRAPG
jgi:hypothetical protein